MPERPAGVEECLRKAFPEIPNRALTKADVTRIVGEAVLLDRAKTGCGLRATSWIEDVLRDNARP